MIESTLVFLVSVILVENNELSSAPSSWIVVKVLVKLKFFVHSFPGSSNGHPLIASTRSING